MKVSYIRPTEYIKNKRYPTAETDLPKETEDELLKEFEVLDCGKTGLDEQKQLVQN
jgi:hypothetical protein